MGHRYAYPAPYEELDHTADLGVVVRGDSVEAVAARLVLAFSHLLSGGAPVAEVERRTIVAAAGDSAAMIVDVLSELLYLFERERLLPSSVEIAQFEAKTEARLEVGFGRYDAALHAEGVVLKAVTLHEARVERDNGGFRGQIVFDV